MGSSSSENASPPNDELSPLGRLLGFLIFSTAGVATLAAAVLLPEYAALADLRAERDALAYQVQCDRRLVVYNERMIHAAQDDPVFVARLMIKHGNYRPAGWEGRSVPTALPRETVPERLAREATNPPPPPVDPAAEMGRWADDPSIKGGLVLLGLGVLAVGMLLFGPDDRPLFANRRRQAIAAGNAASSPT